MFLKPFLAFRIILRLVPFIYNVLGGEIMANKLCDFCLSEGKGLFNQPKLIDDEHYMCKKCKRTVLEYNLPIEFGLFQLLVNAEPHLREMIMNTWLEHHTVEESLRLYYKPIDMPLHKGEHYVTSIKASIDVDPTLIPTEKAVTSISNVMKKTIHNLQTTENGQEAEGLLIQTDAALYFMNEHFINVHRLSNVARDCEDENHIHVLDGSKKYIYHVEHSDLFFMKSLFFKLCCLKSSTKKKNLIYLSSENTMTLTPGIYRVPKNIKSGTYYITPKQEGNLALKDASGRVKRYHDGRLDLDNGSLLELTSEFEFRIHDKNHEDKE